MRLTVLILLIHSTLGFSQRSDEARSYANDLSIYRQALEQSHPSLYRFTPKEKFDALFDSIASNLNDQTTALAFFRSIAQISSLIRESHSYIQPPASLSAQVKNKRLFPFQVLVKDDQLIVSGSRSPALDDLKEATIHAINGQSIPDILKIMEVSTSTVSAFNNSGLKSRLSLYNNFALAYYYFVDTTSTFRIDYRTTSGSSLASMSIKGSNSDLTTFSYPELPPEPKPPFYLEIDDRRSMAVLRISTFAYWLVDQKIKDYVRFFEESFAKLREKGIHNLIIDVRGNRGGEEMIAGELLTYLIDEEFNIYKYCKAKTLDYNFTNSLPKASKVKLSKRNYTATDSGFMMKKADFLNTYLPKSQSHFRGHVYVLSNGVSASACNIFLALIKTHQAGTIVGQESGGAFEDVDGRQRLSFNLPHSGIFVSYPAWAMKLNTKGGDKNRGVLPDHEITPTITETDEEMAFVLNLIDQASQ